MTNPVPGDPSAVARHFPVAVILERRAATSQWADHVWSAAGIAVGRHDCGEQPRLVREDRDTAYFLVGDLQVALYAD